ncbi:hypothetical protein HXX76_002269 [Chlamydomonas incerta]|uniref:Uncharacterized protein n=1 Tax=Chlamydomonas incerta TaxID=51695 RepID=A0A835WAT2_CHLIN|nr:hypothetical protein HXX76_002269 [Chlamydomonas incerta]|eukprot:KAG2443929.1 hypothetical protein HXX76_002269 [Chlamydomonas incerta]
MPSKLHRRVLHQGTCRSYKLSMGITGATELTAAFHRQYPDAVFEFRKATAAAGVYRGKAEEAAQGWYLEA